MTKAAEEELINSRHFEKVLNWPDFKITGDETSGRIPVTKITGWRDLTRLLEDPFFNRPKTQLIYRGHKRYDWNLAPSLGRFDSRSIITAEVAETQLRMFRRSVRGRLTDKSLVEIDEEFELWAVGQHHGLVTPLLDWTYSPYVALFFAFAEEDRTDELDNPYRAIYVLDKTYVEVDNQCPDVHVLEPRKDDHGRLVNQAGLFTYSAYGNTLENFLIQSLEDEVLKDIPDEEEAQELAKYLCKIYIPNEERDDCLRHLRKMNVHHASLFPDLQGASLFCNILIAEETFQLSEKKITPEILSGSEEPLETKTEIPTTEPGQDLVASLREILMQPQESAQVEAGRLARLAQELASEIAKEQYVDWEKRDNVKAAMRNVARVVLRRYGYPVSARDNILDKILDALKANSA